jgi:hypothetical protein
LPSRKAAKGTSDVDEAVDSVSAWAQRYEQLAVRGVRSGEVANRIALHLLRFERYLRSSYDRLSTVVARDVTGWRDSQVAAGLAPATVNNHLASLSGFLAWVGAQAPEALPGGDPQPACRLGRACPTRASGTHGCPGPFR